MQYSDIFSVGLENDNLFKWVIGFQGQQDTLYEVISDLSNGRVGSTRFCANSRSTSPTNRPRCDLSTRCGTPISTLMAMFAFLFYISRALMNRTPRSSSPRSAEYIRWNPVMSVEAVLISIQNMLNHPNINSPANIDASVSV